MSTHELIDIVIGISSCIGGFILVLIAGLIKFYALVSKIRGEINSMSKNIVSQDVIRLIVRDEIKTAIDIHEKECNILSKNKRVDIL